MRHEKKEKDRVLHIKTDNKPDQGQSINYGNDPMD